MAAANAMILELLSRRVGRDVVTRNGGEEGAVKLV